MSKRYPIRKIIGVGMMIVGAPAVFVILPFLLPLLALALTGVALISLYSSGSAARIPSHYNFLTLLFLASATLAAILLSWQFASDPVYSGPFHVFNWLFLILFLVPQLLWWPRLRVLPLPALLISLSSLGLCAIYFAGDSSPSDFITQQILRHYGISYEITSSEHAEYQFIQFHLDRNGKRIEGPEVNDDNLYVDLTYKDRTGPPEILVCSSTYATHLVAFKLNVLDPARPEFDILENRGMGISYAPLGLYSP